jgi:hypothetical protein
MATNNKKKELMVEDTSTQPKWTKTRDIAVPVPSDMPGRQTGAVATAVSAGGTASQGYKPSDAVTHAQDLLKQQMAQKPGAYQSQWQTQLDDIIGKIMNRERFDYDLNGDALYQQYKNNYVQQGKMAMMDTMGQAAALTGGYGNSYAQSVGQQAYHGYLQKLNDVVPELYQLAMDKYRMEGDTLSDQYAILVQQEGLDYGRHRDQMADWHTERDYLSGRYDAERGYDYGLYRDSVADDQWEQSFGYQQERDKVADEQWQAQFDEAKRQYDQNHALQKSKSSGSSSRKTSVPTENKKTAEIGSGAIAGAIVGAIPYAPSGKNVDTTSVDNFLKTLPYANSGTTGDQWRDFVEMRLLEAVESGSLTEAELDMAVKRLGFKY